MQVWKWRTWQDWGCRWGGRLGQASIPGRSSGLHSGQQRLQIPIALGAAATTGRPPLGLSLLEHLWNRGARQNVVKLLEQQRPPVNRRLALGTDRGLGLASRSHLTSDRRPRLVNRSPHGQEQGPGQLRLAQQALQGAVVALLIRPTGGTASMQLQVELIPPHRQLGRQGRQPLEIGAQGAMVLGYGGRLQLPQRQLLQQLGGGATPVIADPRQPEGVADAGGLLPIQAIALDRQRIAIGADRRRHQGQHLTATAAAPAEQAMGEGVGGVPGQLVGAEPAHPGGGRHGRQAGGKAEAVRQPGQVVVPLREGALAVVLPLLELPQQGGGVEQHAVALDPGAIQRLPATGPHRRADAVEQGWPLQLQPGVERRSRMAEMELREALHQIQRGDEGALGRPPGVGHRPEPGEIEVGMTEHLHRAAGGGLRLAPLPPQGPQGRQGGGQQAIGISRIKRFEFQPAVDQGAVVVAGTAQPQLQLQGLTRPPALR